MQPVICSSLGPPAITSSPKRAKDGASSWLTVTVPQPRVLPSPPSYSSIILSRTGMLDSQENVEERVYLCTQAAPGAEPGISRTQPVCTTEPLRSDAATESAVAAATRGFTATLPAARRSGFTTPELALSLSVLGRSRGCRKRHKPAARPSPAPQHPCPRSPAAAQA